MNFKSIDNQTYLAIVFIGLGLGFLAEQLGLINFGWLLGKVWPLAIVGYGLLLLAQAEKSKTLPLIIIAIGTILSINSFNSLGINLWSLFWPLVLVGIGLLILRRGDANPTFSEDHYNATITMSEDKRIITSQNFHGGQVSVWMGGSTLDLTKAKLADQAKLNIQVVMGELKVLVAPDTKIINHITQIAAETKDRTRPSDKPKQTLTIVGNVTLGSMEVTD